MQANDEDDGSFFDTAPFPIDDSKEVHSTGAVEYVGTSNPNELVSPLCES